MTSIKTLSTQISCRHDERPQVFPDLPLARARTTALDAAARYARIRDWLLQHRHDYASLSAWVRIGREVICLHPALSPYGQLVFEAWTWQLLGQLVIEDESVVYLDLDPAQGHLLAHALHAHAESLPGLRASVSSALADPNHTF